MKKMTVDNYIYMGMLLQAARNALMDGVVYISNAVGKTKAAKNVSKLKRALDLIDQLKSELDSELFSDREAVEEVKRLMNPQNVFYGHDCELRTNGILSFHVTIKPQFKKTLFEIINEEETPCQ